jgi:hypothetical protein
MSTNRGIAALKSPNLTERLFLVVYLLQNQVQQMQYWCGSGVAWWTISYFMFIVINLFQPTIQSTVQPTIETTIETTVEPTIVTDAQLFKPS